MRHSERALVTSDGATLWTRQWQPDGLARAAGVLVHGLGEHGGRYAHVGRQLTAAGYALHAFDLRGHGRSSGPRGDTRMEAALDDLERMIVETRSQHGDAPLFLYGHSLGALVVLTGLVRRRPPVAAAILSAPPLRTPLRRQRTKLALVRVLGRLLPGLRLASGLDATAISRDPAVVAAYAADPLVHGVASLGFARDALAASEALAAVSSLELPVLLLHGTADRIALVEGSRELAARLSGDVTRREYEGAFHECHNEPERDRVVADVIGWLDDRVRRRA